MNSEPLRWHIVTGEYPPMPGGVSDYTHQIARALAKAGDQVTVWAPKALGSCPADSGVTVSRLSGNFGPRALWQLSAALRNEQRPFRLLVQYVPQMYGWRGMNLAFCLWLSSLRHYCLWIMFHEVAHPWGRVCSARHNLLSLVQRFMAWLLLRRSQRVFVSIPGWKPMLQQLLPCAADSEWLPIPSNLPIVSAPTRVELRDTLVPPGGLLLGHFGTYGKSIVSLLSSILPTILGSQENSYLLLIGRGSARFAKDFQTGYPHLAHRIFSTGEQPADKVACFLSACDLLIQPFPDGVSSRRTSLMAGLALGVPTVTNRGHLTESIWGEGPVALANRATPDSYQAAVKAILESPVELKRLGCAGGAFYNRWFALERTVTILRGTTVAEPIEPANCYSSRTQETI